MKKIIIGIHGLGNKVAAEQLKNWWLQAIYEGLENIGKSRTNIPFQMAYWADITHPKPLDANIIDKENPLFEDEPYKKGISKQRKNTSVVKEKILTYIENELDKIFLNDDLSINFKDVTDILMRKYFTDLDVYYKDNCNSPLEINCNAKNNIKNRLISLLEKYKDYHILLIAHSMGSIIAFDVLSNLPEGFKIDTFITIGSPLGLPVIVGRIFAQQKAKNSRIIKPAAPNPISQSWINMSDKYDKIAIDHTLSNDFAPNINGVCATDIFVYNNYEINGEPNAHKSYGYLRTPEIATIFDSFLEQKDEKVVAEKHKSVLAFFKSRLNKIITLFRRK